MAKETHSSIALASPLGGSGFGMACLCVGFSFTGIYPVEEGLAMALPMALLFAGLAQFVASILEFCRGSHALGYCHGAYGIWGMGTAIMFYTQLAGLVPAADATAMAVYWGCWAVLTVIITVTCWPTSKAFAGVLALLVVCFALFSAGAFSPLITKVGAWATVVDGLSAWYCVAAFSINTSFGRKVLPIA
jgi:succinate-acetate transporter protein